MISVNSKQQMLSKSFHHAFGEGKYKLYLFENI